VFQSEYRKASKAKKAVFKGATYLFLRERSNIGRLKDRRHLEELLRLNKVINAVLILKDKLKHIWSERALARVDKAIDGWCCLAKAVSHLAMREFAKTLERYRYGILNHCEYLIHTGRLKGVNNKIKVIKLRAYVFDDHSYFSLKSFKFLPPKKEKTLFFYLSKFFTRIFWGRIEPLLVLTKCG